MKVIATRDFYNNRPRQINLGSATQATGWDEGKKAPNIRALPKPAPNAVPMGSIFSIGGLAPDGSETHQGGLHPNGDACPRCMSATDSDLLAMLKHTGNIEVAEDEDGKPTIHVERVAKEVARHERFKALHSIKQPTAAQLLEQLNAVQAQIKALIPAAPAGK